MRRFRVVRGELDRTIPASPDLPEDPADPALTGRLRSVYAPPADGYWDGLEATIMAAVRAGRAAPAKTVEWWQTLARWARPGLAAAAVLLGVVGGVYVQTRGSRVDAVYRAVLEEPSYTIEPMSEEFARVSDLPTAQPASAEARAAADLLTDGVKRRTHVPAELQDAAALEAAEAAASSAAQLIDGESLLAGRRPSSRRLP
jgi:hypothetical protein